MRTNIKDILIEKINQSEWWHVTPSDKNAYKKRGKFFASTYKQAEFYGRPNISPERVNISNPIFGFSEIEILKNLFPKNHKKLYSTVTNQSANWYKNRIKLDAQMFKKAKSMGHDAIVLVASNGKKFIEKCKKPHSIELNILK